VLTAVALLVTLHGPAAAGPPSRGLVEATGRGEVLFLPRHHVQPFVGWVYSRAATSCLAVESAMLDPERWPKIFENLKRARATRTGDTVRYELDLTVAFSPTIHGVITRMEPGRLRFSDVETKAYSEYTLEDLPDGTCLSRYSVVEEQGRSSGWVGIIKGLEATAGDAGNFAAAISSSRGFSRPERAPRVTPGRAGEQLLDELAGRGTVVSIDRSGRRPVYVLRRRVAASFDEVTRALRDRATYARRTAVVRSSAGKGGGAEYAMGGFGGRVNFTTTVREAVDAAGVLSIEETPASGDLQVDDGGWRWRVNSVDGGAEVELRFGCDVIDGSLVLKTVANTDPIARESFMLHVALSLVGDLVPGRPLPLSPAVVASPPPPATAVVERSGSAVGAGH